MKYYVLASGSKGNATIIVSHNHVILIDMGLSLKKFQEKLAETPYSMEDIEAILVTHNHSDHTAGLKYLSSIPLYTAKGTYKTEDDYLLTPYETYQIAGFKVTVLPTSHDAINPVGFVFEDDEEKLVYMTDTGYVSERNLSYMQNAHYYIFESNHDVRMLLATKRTYELKQRILGDEGHLSNEDSAYYLSKCVGPSTKEIVLAHLSEEANNPDKALAAIEKVFRNQYLNTHNYVIQTASQYEVVSGGEEIKL